MSADFSRSGQVSLPVAKITSAELDAIEAELSNPKKRTDVLAIALSVFSTGAYISKAIEDPVWAQKASSLLVVFASIGVVFIQLYRLYQAKFHQETAHERNVSSYVKKLRSHVQEAEKGGSGIILAAASAAVSSGIFSVYGQPVLSSTDSTNPDADKKK